MLDKIGTHAMRQKMGEILDCVNLRGDEFIIERKDKEIAALISVTKLRAILRGASKFLQEFLDRQKGEMTEEEALELAEEAKTKSRQKYKS